MTTAARDHVRVVVVDDHPMVRAGLRAQLDMHPDIEVVADADSARDAIDACAQHHPDVVLVDHQIRDGFGIDILPRLPAEGRPAVVLVSVSEDQSLVSQYLRAGASGYVHKTAGPSELARCVLAAAAGSPAMDPGSVQRALLAPASPATQTAPLSAREVQVLTAVCDGLTNDAIGSRLGISAQTVKTHLTRIFGKLGVADRAQAAAVATRRGLL